MKNIGLYLHIPFCRSKCPYCDFYSLTNLAEDDRDAYMQSLVSHMEQFAGEETADTLYFGGGTPSLLGGKRLARLIKEADRLFSLLSASAPEITVEANPGDDLEDCFARFTEAGGNRLSLGMQSGVDDELHLLGRRHTVADVLSTVKTAQATGLRNISLDLMLGIPGQTESTLRQSVDILAQTGAAHASAYLLKCEPGTPFGDRPPVLPDEDATAGLYLSAMQLLEEKGYEQYEISNTAKKGMASRHNLKYWHCEEYLGLGPAAASYFRGERFSYPRDLSGFIRGNLPGKEPDASIPAGSPEEYAMLALRLTEGLTRAGFVERFGTDIPAEWRKRAQKMPSHLVTADEDGIRFSKEGFLVSNTLIGNILTNRLFSVHIPT